MGKHRKVFAWLAFWLLLPLVLYVWLQSTPYDGMIKAPHEHFYVVSLVSVLALAVAAAVGIVAIRIRNSKVSFLSLAYVSLAGMFILHGLSTPGFLMHHSAIAGNAAQLSVLLAAFWLWMCSISGDHRLVRWLSERQLWLLPAWSVILLLFGSFLWRNPELVHWLNLRDELGKWVVTAVVLLLNGWTVYRNLQTYSASRLPLQLAIAYSTGWMFVAQLIMVTGQSWRASWWLYHVLLLASVIVMVIGIAREHLSTGSLTSSIRRLFRAAPQDWIHTYISPSVKELVFATEAKDAYTAGHNYRVALYALKLGEELGLSLSQLRAIAQGGLVHDIGKLAIPDGILNKPGKLTDEERVVIETHPVSGYDMCKRLGFMLEELAVIRSHHEKWNGSGYPDKLAGEDIPLVARITAVADVYDALTSSRSYRKAMTHEEAMDILLRESGRHFDPRCIAAWEKLVKEQQQFILETSKNSDYVRLDSDGKTG
ncbi:HD-GYP domain-containing protein [Paenibacillus sp. LHD-117]|uniref:HD-GYP domain-containing protein n=1 Tax=Paenibacillus sp. LHD-117 TaxID=3071412 RepID=UPI0027DEEB8A|nr:HD-GYP domain-containing protein [Paenibacillus sp. LHD-117]MDQ6423191.1 HD-GYP domain-containing protein [Paenibacillus sp. LHD-117]